MIILINTIACWYSINKISLIWIFTPFARAYVEKLIVPYRYLFGGTVYCNSYFNETKKRFHVKKNTLYVNNVVLPINQQVACMSIACTFTVIWNSTVINFHPIVVNVLKCGGLTIHPLWNVQSTWRISRPWSCQSFSYSSL
jgi:hypothetical protein